MSQNVILSNKPKQASLVRDPESEAQLNKSKKLIKQGKKRRKEKRSRATAYEALTGKLSIYPDSRGAERERLRREIYLLADKLQLRKNERPMQPFYFGQIY